MIDKHGEVCRGPRNRLALTRRSHRSGGDDHLRRTDVPKRPSSRPISRITSCGTSSVCPATTLKRQSYFAGQTFPVDVEAAFCELEFSEDWALCGCCRKCNRCRPISRVAGSNANNSSSDNWDTPPSLCSLSAISRMP